LVLTNAQLQTLKTDIAADPVLNALPRNGDGYFATAAAYNALVSPNFFVFRTNVPVDEIQDQIVWANFTPNVTDFSTGFGTTVAYSNAALLCQGKQFNLQMLMTRTNNLINASKQKIRDGLQDALTNIPSGNNGNARQGGWASVQTILARLATRGEKLFANTGGGNGSTALLAATMVVEGLISAADVERARELP
jgi:hypothetical protein